MVNKVRSRRDGKTYVLKKIKCAHMSEKRQRDAMTEVLLLRQLNHPYIIGYYSSFVEGKSIYIVMEYAPNGDLQRLVSEHTQRNSYVPEKTLWKLLFQLVQALDHLHCKKIIHRDIKLVNVFMDESYSVKLGDLGVARILDGHNAMAQSRVGTPLYLAPELIQRLPYSFKADVWALGVLLYTMCALKGPFLGDNIYALGYSIIHDTPPPLPAVYSRPLVQLVWSMLEKTEARRPSVSELLVKLHSVGLTDVFHPRLPSSADAASMQTTAVATTCDSHASGQLPSCKQEPGPGSGGAPPGGGPHARASLHLPGGAAAVGGSHAHAGTSGHGVSSGQAIGDHGQAAQTSGALPVGGHGQAAGGHGQAAHAGSSGHVVGAGHVLSGGYGVSRHAGISPHCSRAAAPGGDGARPGDGARVGDGARSGSDGARLTSEGSRVAREGARGGSEGAKGAAAATPALAAAPAAASPMGGWVGSATSTRQTAAATQVAATRQAAAAAQLPVEGGVAAEAAPAATQVAAARNSAVVSGGSGAAGSSVTRAGGSVTWAMGRAGRLQKVARWASDLQPPPPNPATGPATGSGRDRDDGASAAQTQGAVEVRGSGRGRPGPGPGGAAHWAHEAAAQAAAVAPEGAVHVARVSRAGALEGAVQAAAVSGACGHEAAARAEGAPPRAPRACDPEAAAHAEGVPPRAAAHRACEGAEPGGVRPSRSALGNYSPRFHSVRSLLPDLTLHPPPDLPFHPPPDLTLHYPTDLLLSTLPIGSPLAPISLL